MPGHPEGYLGIQSPRLGHGPAEKPESSVPGRVWAGDPVVLLPGKQKAAAPCCWGEIVAMV